MVSVVVPCFNRWDLTSRCLPRIGDAEIVLVDNGSTDDTRFAGPAVADVTIRNRTNQGFARGCNQGFGAASGEVVVFLNNDTEPQPGWLDAIEAAFDNPDVLVAGCRIVRPDGTLDHSGVHVDFTKPPGAEAWHDTSDGPTRWVQAVTGAALAVRAEWFPGFDEGYRNGYEDIDLCLRAGKVRYVAEATVMHHVSQSGPQRWAHVSENVARLRDRWGD